MAPEFDENMAEGELKKGYDIAKEMLADKDKMEEFLQKLEKKLKIIPLVGDKLAAIPIMASLVKDYVEKEYTDVPIGTILAVLSALIYVVLPIDLIPEAIPVIGYVDDAAVVRVCWSFVNSDIEKYEKWRKENGEGREQL